jgi:DNA-binding GntR family transcriptional regulator
MQAGQPNKSRIFFSVIKGFIFGHVEYYQRPIKCCSGGLFWKSFQKGRCRIMYISIPAAGLSTASTGPTGLVELKIAKDLGVSQGPVREALQELEVMGLVYKKAYSGSFVASFSEEEIIGNFKLRTVLETFAIKEAIKKMGEPEIREMELILDKILEAKNNLDIEASSNLDIEFHSAFVKGARIPSLYKAWEISRIAQWTYITLSNKDTFETVPQSHIALLKFIKEKNEEKAVAVIEKHFNNALGYVLKMLAAGETAAAESK